MDSQKFIELLAELNQEQISKLIDSAIELKSEELKKCDYELLELA